MSADDLARLDVFVTCLAIGLMMGAERERRPSAKAGIRTFALIALLAPVLSEVGRATGLPWLPALGFVAVGATMIAAYAASPVPDDPGTTTIVATLLCYGLAVMAVHGEAQIAVMVAIAATALLYFKTELRGVSLGLDRNEALSILQFAVFSFIVLPLLPDRNFGPFDALNPRQIWWMVVLVSGVSLAGYLALKLVGQRHGTWLLGLFGGLVSSTATTLVYARHAKADPAAVRLSAPVIVIANVVVLFRIAVVVAVVAPALLPVVGASLLPGVVAGAAGAALLWRRLDLATPPPMPEVGNPAAARAALFFGGLYALVLLAAAWARDATGAAGLYGIAVVSGLSDVDAITLSALRLNSLGQISPDTARTTVALALVANNAFKLMLAFGTGGRALGIRCAGPMAAVSAGLLLGLLVPSAP